MKKMLLTLVSALTLSVSTTHADVTTINPHYNNPNYYNFSNLSITSIEHYAVIDLLEDNKDALMLPLSRQNPKITKLIPIKYLPTLLDYTLYYKVESYYKPLTGAAYVETIQKDFHLYRARFIEELKTVVEGRTRAWHATFKHQTLLTINRGEDRQIRDKKDATRKQTDSLKAKFRSDVEYTKNWYRPRIENGSKTKAHLKGRLIEIKNEFSLKVRTLKYKYENFRHKILTNRRARAQMVDQILRNDVENVNKLTISFDRFSQIQEYDYDEYVRKGGK